MTDTALPGTNVLPAPAGQPTGAQNAQAEAATEKPAAYLTRDEAIRLAQSAADKATDRLRKQVNEQFKQIEQAYKLTGKELTPDEAATVRRNLVDNLFSTPAPDPLPEQTPASDPAQAETDNPVMNAAYELLKTYGVEFQDGDPELTTIKLDGSAGEYLASVATAAANKKARISQAPTPTNPQGALPAGGLLQGSTTPSSFDPTEDPTHILERAFKR